MRNVTTYNLFDNHLFLGYSFDLLYMLEINKKYERNEKLKRMKRGGWREKLNEDYIKTKS